MFMFMFKLMCTFIWIIHRLTFASIGNETTPALRATALQRPQPAAIIMPIMQTLCRFGIALRGIRRVLPASFLASPIGQID